MKVLAERRRGKWRRNGRIGGVCISGECVGYIRSRKGTPICMLLLNVAFVQAS